MSHAQIKDGVVVNCIVASDEYVAEVEGLDGFTYVKYVDADGHPIVFNPYPGCTYDEVTGEFVPPPLDPNAPPPVHNIILSPNDEEIEEALSVILGF